MLSDGAHGEGSGRTWALLCSHRQLKAGTAVMAHYVSVSVRQEIVHNAHMQTIIR